MFKLKNNKKRKGFTLIEMVIVITIIGILSSIAVTKYSKVQENAKKNADYATAANLATAAMISISDGNTSVQPSNLESDGYIQFVPVSKSVKGNEFVVTAQGDSVTVKIGTETFYPKSNETNKN
ncbi:MAG TPA: type II secretion system protein [Terrisporobacter glycolicus]|uniref:Type IV pilus assembly protein PilA n=1 Tax=Terrisporobacter petrolearius TaxID=1460447 RepID=A0ABZ3FBL8_9FIRM|nr:MULTISPECIES: type II secretion system protein [Terrisporobacter]MBN9647938.1 type II secretion system protein [Terrisporobacter glycolicus]HBI93917.1 type II secretion system protein [Terrisporobacter hibernicus]